MMRRMRGLRRRKWLATIAVPLVLVALPGMAGADDTSQYRYQLVAKAVPDECFNGVGVAYPPGPPCAVGQPKVNQAYVWGLAQVHNKVWFGTGANVACLVSGFTLDVTDPILNDDFVCEYGQSQAAKANPDLLPALGDQRPPQLMYYDKKNHHLVDESGVVDAASPADKARRAATIGIRAGGAFNGVVLFGGPNLNPNGGVNLFAFDGDSGRYLGSTELTNYGNIRHFLVADGELYAGMGIGANGDSGGAVLRWTGSKQNPFSFVDVGDINVQAADLTLYDGRIFISSWPHNGPKSAKDVAGIWMSPPLHRDSPDGPLELTEADATGWTQVWNVLQYEPDPLVAATYGMGGIAAYGGDLYFGTMHVPLKASKVFQTIHPSKDPAFVKAGIANTQRAAAVFRASGFGTDHQKIELLYGASQLPKFFPDGAGGGTWKQAPTGWTPLFGASGFGNPFNNYEWVMTVAAHKLFIGTMDWSYLAKDLVPPNSGVNIDPTRYGGELWTISSPGAAATAVNTTGIGNYLNYGVRNMIPDGDTLWLGMADPMNLRTDPTDDVPEGGWELIKMDVG